MNKQQNREATGERSPYNRASGGAGGGSGGRATFGNFAAGLGTN